MDNRVLRESRCVLSIEFLNKPFDIDEAVEIVWESCLGIFATIGKLIQYLI